MTRLMRGQWVKGHLIKRSVDLSLLDRDHLITDCLMSDNDLMFDWPITVSIDSLTHISLNSITRSLIA